MSNKNQIQELNQTAWQLRHTDRKECESLSHQALELALADSDKLGQGFALRTLAHCQITTGQPEQSLELLTQALEIAQTQQSQLLERDCLNLLAGVHNWFGDLERAVSLISDAYRLSIYLKDAAQISSCLNNISVIYHQLGQNLTALEYAQEAVQQATNTGDQVREAIALSNAALASSGLSQFENGLRIIEKSQILCQEQGLEELQLRNRVNRIEILIGLKNLEEAQSEVSQCLEIVRTLEIAEGEAQCLLMQSQIQLAQTNYSQAEQTATLALKIAITAKMRGPEAKICYTLAQAHKGLAQYATALEFTAQAQAIEAEVRTEGAHRRMRTLSKLNLVDRLENLLRSERAN